MVLIIQEGERDALWIDQYKSGGDNVLERMVKQEKGIQNNGGGECYLL